MKEHGMNLVTVRICGVEATESGAEILDKVLERTAKTPAKSRKLMDAFGLLPRDVVDLAKGLISLAAANGEMPEVGPLSPPAIGDTSRGVKAAVNGVLARFQAAHLADVPTAKDAFDTAVLDFNSLAWSIAKAKGVVVFFSGEHEWIFPTVDPKLLRVRRPDLDVDQVIESRLVKGCEVTERMELAMFREPTRIVSVIIKVTGPVPSFKAKMPLGDALGDWSRVLLTARVAGKKGAIPQLRGDLSLERVPIEQLTSEPKEKLTST